MGRHGRGSRVGIARQHRFDDCQMVFDRFVGRNAIVAHHVAQCLHQGIASPGFFRQPAVSASFGDQGVEFAVCGHFIIEPMLAAAFFGQIEQVLLQALQPDGATWPQAKRVDSDSRIRRSWKISWSCSGPKGLTTAPRLCTKWTTPLASSSSRASRTGVEAQPETLGKVHHDQPRAGGQFALEDFRQQPLHQLMSECPARQYFVFFVKIAFTHRRGNPLIFSRNIFWCKVLKVEPTGTDRRLPG